MISDTGIQLSIPSFNLPSQAPIGGVNPLSYLRMAVGTSQFFSISGSTDPTKYSAAEWYWNRPLLPSSGHFKLTAKFRLNAAYPANWQAKELDVKLTCADLLTRNFSFQLQPWNRKFCVSQQDGTWFEAGSFPLLDPTKPHMLELDYLYDTSSANYSSALPTLDGEALLNSRTFTNLTATSDGWAPGWATIQYQLGQTLDAGGIADELDYLQLDWF